MGSAIFQNPPALIAIALVIVFAIGLHEFSHAKFADLAGDPTPRYYGRVTLNLFNHFDPLGTIMIFMTLLSGYGIGWGKPVPMDPSKMKNPRWDHFVAVLAGPVSNILQAIFYALMFRLLATAAPHLLQTPFITYFLLFGVMINLGLCFFNLFPLGPLDGMWLVGTFMSDPMRHAWTRWNLTIGQFAFLGLVILGQVSGIRIISTVIGVPIDFFTDLLLGGVLNG
jgi:Zn-dependent protease